MSNIQSRNVGNLGDILKHAALTKLLNLVRQRAGGHVNYLDTHTFLLEAPCANSKWAEDCSQLASKSLSYQGYVDLESTAVAGGQYLCSTRIALELLGAPGTHLYLGESDPDTRQVLRQQLAVFDVPALILKPDMLDYENLKSVELPGAVFALVDPFLESEEQWQKVWRAACRAVEVLHAPQCPGLVEVFNWRKTSEVCWPAPPVGFEGPIAAIRRPAGPQGAFYHLAVYATSELVVESSIALTELGWIGHEKKLSATASVPSSHPSRRGRLFDRYIMADYSGAESEDTQKKKIVLVNVDGNPGSKPQIVYGLTRKELSKRIVEAIQQATARGERVLFGIDHQYGWPMPLLDACGLGKLDWRQALESLRSGAYGGPPLSHPNSFCRDLNAFVQNQNLPAPFFSPSCMYGLPQRSQFAGGMAPFRLTEEVLIRQGHAPKPATEIGTRGAVGGQTICGLKGLAELQKAIFELQVQFWPFDGLCIESPLYIGKHTGVEIYPTLLRPEDVAQSDESDALYSALWFKKEDAGGLLSQRLDLTALSSEQERILREGWIAGCVSGMPEEGGRDDTPIRRKAVCLTSEQESVVASVAPLARVVARAGTGKTTTMVSLAAKILSQDSAAKVAMLTFTRNAADSMRTRFVDIGGDGTRFEAGTYHGFALKRLLEYGQRVALGDGLTLDLASVQLLNELGRDAMLDYVRKGPGRDIGLRETWAEELSRLINTSDPGKEPPVGLLKGATPTKALPDPERAWRLVLELYCRAALMDFDIIMVLFEYLLRTDGAFLAKARSQLSHVIADEFQDTNMPQLQALAILSGHAGSGVPPCQTVVVGDDFQTIYRWRGAVPGIFEQFATWGQCATLGLRTNWRSGADVLRVVNAAARRLASHPEHASLVAQVPAELVMGRADLSGGVAAFPSVLDAVNFLQGPDVGLSPDSITVLAFKNETTIGVRDDLRSAGISCELATARPADVPSVRRFMALLYAWALRGKRQFSNWWFLASEYGGCSAEEFDEIWRLTAEQSPEQNICTLASLLGPLETPFNEAYVAEDVSQATPELVKRVAIRFFADPIIAVEKDTCLRLAGLLGGSTKFRSEPGRTLGEMTRKDFAAGDGLSKAVQISTIHQYKGLENQGIVLVYDFNPLTNGDSLRLDYVARSRAARWLIAVDLPKTIVDDGF